jgi:hypothetical protein
VTIRHLPILLALVAAVAVGALAVPAAGQAATPCWKRLINDWYDGRIDNVYPVKCYREAIKHLPEDVQAYSDARRDIERALLSAIRKEQDAGHQVRPGTLVPGQPDTGTGKTSTEGSDEEAVAGGGPDEGDSDGLAGVLKPANADSVPIPLLVLAGLALVLLAAASAGFVARRFQARRVRASAVPPERETP